MAGFAGAVRDFLFAFKSESRSLCLVAQYKCFGDERPVREPWLGFFPAPNGKLRKSRFGTWFSAVSRSISASEMIEGYLMRQQKPASPS